VPKFDAYLQNVATDVNTMWAAAFQEAGVSYRSPKLVIVDRSQRVTEPCDPRPVPGTLQNAFWCSRDDNVYLFSDFLRRAVLTHAGAFGVAYVVAHEWGHHVQLELGYWKVFAREHLATIRSETQADCLAGIWAQSAYDRGIVTQADVQQIIAATDLVGDARGTPSRAAGAHGLAGLRAAWFLNGFNGTSVDDCKTF
jgi:predicted metalloprotease